MALLGLKVWPPSYYVWRRVGVAMQMKVITEVRGQLQKQSLYFQGQDLSLEPQTDWFIVAD